MRQWKASTKMTNKRKWETRDSDTSEKQVKRNEIMSEGWCKKWERSRLRNWLETTMMKERWWSAREWARDGMKMLRDWDRDKIRQKEPMCNLD